MGERRDLRLLGIRFLWQLLRPHVLEHTTHDRAIEPRLAGLDLLDGLDEHVGGLILEQHAQRAAAHGVPVGRGVTNPGEDEYACRPGDRQQIGENIKAVLARHIQVQQDDIGLLTRGQPDRRIQVAGLADDVQVGLLLDEHAEPGPDHGVVVDDHDPERRANCVSN